MAMIACGECGHQVSDRAMSCPACGAPIAGTPAQTPTTTAEAAKHAGLRVRSHTRFSRVLLVLVVLWLIGTTLWLVATLRWHDRLFGMIDASIQAARQSLSAQPPSVPAVPTTPSAAAAVRGSATTARSTLSAAPSAEHALGPQQGVALRAIYQTTADQLYQDYDSNAVQTQSRIGDSWIRVTGTIAGIDEDSSGLPVITLSTTGAGGAAMTLGADQRAAAAQLVKGESVQIQCDRMRRLQGVPAGSGCTLALIDAGTRAVSAGPVSAGTRQVYLSVFLANEAGRAPLYVVGPMSQAACLSNRDSLSEQLRGDDRIAFRSCAATARERIAPQGCRLTASVSALPDLPGAHLWRYECGRTSVPPLQTRQASSASPVILPPIVSQTPAAGTSEAAAASPPAAAVATSPLAPAAPSSAAASPPGAAAPSAASRQAPQQAVATRTVNGTAAVANGTAAVTRSAAVTLVTAAPAATPSGAPPPVGATPAPPPAAATSPPRVAAAGSAATPPGAAAAPAAAPTFTDLAPVRERDPQAAQRIASYCTSSTVRQSDSAAAAASCRRNEEAAWTRLVVNDEFPTLDQATRRKCNEPPFPPSYVATEICARYELHLDQSPVP